MTSISIKTPFQQATPSGKTLGNPVKSHHRPIVIAGSDPSMAMLTNRSRSPQPPPAHYDGNAGFSVRCIKVPTVSDCPAAQGLSVAASKWEKLRKSIAEGRTSIFPCCCCKASRVERTGNSAFALAIGMEFRRQKRAKNKYKRLTPLGDSGTLTNPARTTILPVAAGTNS